MKQQAKASISAHVRLTDEVYEQIADKMNEMQIAAGRGVRVTIAAAIRELIMRGLERDEGKGPRQ